jgi:hypothetical protein
MKRRFPRMAWIVVGMPLLLASFGLWGCGSEVAPLDVTSQPASTGPAATSTPTVPGGPTTVTIRDTGISTTSTTPPSVPALEGGLTSEQVLELVAARSNVPAEDWGIRNCTNLGDWAVANLYTSQLSEQMDERGVTAVFEKREGAWFQAGWVSVSDPPEQQVVELANMGAPEEVWRYFGLEAAAGATGQSLPPEQSRADFAFVAAYGVMARNVVDTFVGTFTKDLVSAGQVTTELRLSEDEMQNLYEDLVEMQAKWQLFTTPFSINPDPDNTGTSMRVTPSHTYRLEWQFGEFRSVPIIWDDNSSSSDPKAVALRDWFSKLRRMIEAKPEYQALPPAKGGYA